MSKRTSEVIAVVEAYVSELREQLPFVETEIDSIKGTDVYLRVMMPPEQWDEEYGAVSELTSSLNYRYWNDTDVFIVSIIVTKQPEGAHHG
ncbi:MAG TPA: hypothetical protein VFY10_13430 [Dehalococcoidia bacterium]|nr:hypothetical protein [Dehalococcoidia bacterium]